MLTDFDLVFHEKTLTRMNFLMRFARHSIHEKMLVWLGFCAEDCGWSDVCPPEHPVRKHKQTFFSGVSPFFLALFFFFLASLEKIPEKIRDMRITRYTEKQNPHCICSLLSEGFLFKELNGELAFD